MALMFNKELIVIGHTVIDTVTHPGRRPKILAGGSAPAVATAAVQLGVDTALVSPIGDDFPKNWKQDLSEQYGIDVKGLTEKTGNSTKIDLIYDKKGDLDKINVDHGVSKEMSPQDIPQSFLPAKMMLICPLPVPLQRNIIEHISNQIGLLALDFNQVYSEYYKLLADKKDLSFLNGVNVVFPNEFEAMLLTNETDLYDAAKHLFKAGPDLVVITRGNKGSLIYNGRQNIYREIPSLNFNITDTTGCGDSFIGGFMSQYTQTADPVKSAIAGTALASFVVEKEGSWCPKISLTQFQKRYDEVKKKVRDKQ